MAVSQWCSRYSRFQNVETYESTDGRLFCEEREPMDPPPEGNYFEHTVKSSDTLFTLAGYYYHGLLPRAASFWWAIAEANDIVDPTQPLKPAATLRIPDFQYVVDWIGYEHPVYV